MFKKLGASLALLVIACSIALVNAQPVFAKYADSYEIYLESASSLASIKRVSKTEYFLTSGIEGESVSLSATDFDLDKLLFDFDAQIKFSEQTSDSKIYYAYSPKIKRLKTVKGQKINLHIVVSSEKVVLGSPLIFGSF